MTGASPPPAVLVTTAVDDEEAAGHIARALVEERLAACVHVAPPVASTYWWQGKVESAREWVVQCKTTPERVAAVMARVRALHPYQVPEVLATPVLAGDPDYLAWLRESTTPPASGAAP